MHSVERSPEPAFFAEFRTAHTEWDDLDGTNRRRIRDALIQDFGRICAYCERACQFPTGSGESSNEETIDHFRPRNRFPDLWLDWLNLVYACHRCNQNKGGSWPGYDDALTNQWLSAEDSRYTPVWEYVNPNAVDGQQPAGEFFGFNVETGEMAPAWQLDDVEWSIARRTIRDINLNDSELGENDPNHLWNRRLRQRDLLIQRLDSLEDFAAKIHMICEFTLPDKPFSAFISAYFRGLSYGPTVAPRVGRV